MMGGCVGMQDKKHENRHVDGGEEDFRNLGRRKLPPPPQPLNTHLRRHLCSVDRQQDRTYWHLRPRGLDYNRNLLWLARCPAPRGDKLFHNQANGPGEHME